MKKLRILKRFFSIFALILLLSNQCCVSAVTVSELMSVAIRPIGKCLYVYGGGWNESDNGAGIEAMTMGVSDNWIAFYNQNDKSYDYKQTRYRIHNGLDCTGYVGWCMYQIFSDCYSNTGYVYQSRNMANAYAEIFNGTLIRKSHVTDYQCGDVMCSSGHVYIVLGQCLDKSVVLLHASPPNVSLCGTYTPNGNQNSEAIWLARQYMKAYFSECYEKYSRCFRNVSYLTDYDQMRWNETVLEDTDGYRHMTADQILSDLFDRTKLYVNGNRVAKDSDIHIIDGSTFVPLRTVAEHLGASVTWEPQDQRISMVKDNVCVLLSVGSDTAEINGEKVIFNTPIFLAGESAYVPVRMLAETFGAEVLWDELTKSVRVTTIE